MSDSGHKTFGLYIPLRLKRFEYGFCVDFCLWKLSRKLETSLTTSSGCWHIGTSFELLLDMAIAE